MDRTSILLLNDQSVASEIPRVLSRLPPQRPRALDGLAHVAGARLYTMKLSFSKETYSS